MMAAELAGEFRKQLRTIGAEMKLQSIKRKVDRLEELVNRARIYRKSSDQVLYTKAFDFAVKSADIGVFTGYASTWDLDRQGDVIEPGSFRRTIEETGGRWPVLMAHDMGRIVGFSTEAREDSKGLWVAGEFTMNSDEGRNAYATVSHSARCGIKLGLSIGYGIPDGGARFDERRNMRRISAVNVYEFSIASVQANPTAQIASVKGAY